jgi:poly-gamma-glutamate capsule biosynthesis protein CapA/YwtB (metallophosphatase superfamily)
VTVDAKTFATLKQSPVVTASADTTSSELTMSGKVIRKGEQTSVNMVADVEDMREILEQVRHARARADVVIVTAHSHEPSNRSTAPAEFFRNFARAAVDAGAGLVIGQGPHQLRGIEIYHAGIIFYSLGNFMFDFSAVDPRSEDPFEAGADLYRVALGAVADNDASPQQSVDNPVWWESVIPIVHFEHGVLQSVRLQPIDLGVGLPAGQRGVPRLASANRGHEILKRLADLSREFGTRIRIENAAGVIDRQ